jgi:hypothetical protein
MKLLKTIKRKLKDESGQALAMALIMLVLGGLLVVPTLSFMTTNLNANRQIDRKNLELYAADAGVEQVLWNIKYNQPTFTLPTGTGEQTVVNGLQVNGKTIVATISKQGSDYRITSTASADDHSTTVECYIDAQADLSWFFDSAITAAQDVTIKPGTVVTGDVTYGTSLDNKGEIIGEEIYDPNLATSWPTAEYLSSYYYEQVDDLEDFGSSQITISGGRTNPTTIPRLYRDGNLELKGGGWARLGVDTKAGTADATEANFLSDADGEFAESYVGSTVWNTTDDTYALVSSYVSSGKLGISKDIMANDETYTMYNKSLPVYVTGALSVNPTGGCVLDLNGNTFFSGDTIYLGPKTTIRGSGCFIAVGNINFQPNLGSAGDKLVGVDYTTSSSSTELKNILLLSKFTAEYNGKVKTFSVLTSGASSSVKLAMYDANPITGEPTTLMLTPDNLPSATASMPVGSGLNGLNDIDFPETEVTAGKSYWLAAICNNDNVIGYKTFTTPYTWESRTKTGLTYSSFTFPETLTDYGLTEVTNKQYLLAGNALPFLFVMSIEGSSDIKPGGTLYGSIAGNAEVELFPGNTLTLTDVPETGLDFPGPDTSTDDTTGTPATIRTYTIK